MKKLNYDRQIKEHHVGITDESKKEYKLFGLDDTKRFHWDIITICNYNCSYCYSRAETQQWNKITNKQQIDDVFEKLDQINHPLEVIILGGEPTIHPNYFYIFDRLLDMGDKLQVMGNITNGSFKNKDDKEFILQHNKYKEKFHWNMTFHPSEITDVQKFKDNILFIVEQGQRININVMLVDVQYKDITEDMLDFLTENKIRYYFNVIFDHKGTVYANYNKDYSDWLKSLTEKYGGIKELVYFKDDVVIGKYNDIDVYLNNYSDFMGWKCKNNNYQIGVGGSEFAKFCSYERVTVDQINNEDQFMICPLAQCLCQGKLTSEKIYQPN